MSLVVVIILAAIGAAVGTFLGKGVGLVAGEEFRCITLESYVKCHTSDELPEVKVGDMKLLHQ